MIMVDTATPTEARQRRMELRRQSTLKSVQNRNREIEDDDMSCISSDSHTNSTSSTMSVTEASTTKKRKAMEVSSNAEVDLSIFRGIKKQARYEPTVPISSKAELAAWRKEARRIRNRESAAASRNKTRQRIEELEEQLQKMQDQYNTALRRIGQLESLLTQTSKSESQVPTQEPLTADPLRNQVSPTLSPSPPSMSPSELNITEPNENDHELLIWSPEHQDAARALANSLLYATPTSEEKEVKTYIVAPEPYVDNQVTSHEVIIQSSPIVLTPTTIVGAPTNHQNLKISRPTAVCVVPIQKSQLFSMNPDKNITLSESQKKSLTNLPAAKTYSGDSSGSNNINGVTTLDGYLNASDCDVTGTKSTSINSSQGIESLFQSVDVATFQDIFTDDATMKWMTSVAVDDDPSFLSSSESSTSDDDGDVYVHEYDETELGEFLLDVLVS